MIGRIVSDRYRVMEYLGGGMSSVYLAHDIILDREVVLKMIKVDHHNREKSKARFQREVESTIHLAHPNIVSVLDVDESEEYHLLVTEVVHGPTLKSFIDENHPISIDEVIRISEMILRGIRHAHSAGIIHRDIKPQNLLMDETQQIKITDFGIAKALSETRLTETNQVMGSVQYISPEQAKGHMTDERTDIYSFGIVLYELITGELPFDGETPVSVALKHISEPFPNISRHRDIHEDLAYIVYKCTEKDPHRRYRQVDDVVKDLNSFKEGRPISAAAVPADIDRTVESAPVKPPVSKEPEEQQETPAPPKKRRWMLWLLPVLLILGALAILFYLFLSGDDPIALPDMQDMTMDDAEAVLSDNGLVMGEVSEEYNSTFAEGRIVETTPVSGTEVEKGATVDFIISRGEEPYVMENFTGESYDSVLGSINDLGFDSLEVEEAYDDSEPGTIISQSIEPGTEVDPSESSLSLTISQGIEPVEMRNYTGQLYNSVEAELAEQGFAVELEQVYDSSESGTILTQSIEAGTEVVPTDETLVLTISRGPQSIVLEDYTGQSYDAVREELETLGFELQVEEENDSADEGTILSQSIEAGTEVVPSEETLTLTVSQGPAQIEITDYTGEPFDTAKAALEEQGFTVEMIQEAYSSEVEEGSVISQTPDEGELVPEDTNVRMVVSLGAEPAREKEFVKEITIPYASEEDEAPDEEDGSEPKNVEIYIEDSEHSIEDPADTIEITEDTEYTISLIIQEGEMASYRIEREGEVIAEEEIPYE
ncbi:Stk1 family PASTA domain-containing Ser/Thr kinase [Salinicoccus cyprini]|uniref:non-specific serine/threonine protein kinase n=1 Tax=Salinicoccus cyprini TaxID=2493691 RepID=A0A558AY21_9STAP|nr:Stk1 family PASTA domain-containing Ser/Thr kinase [Salinicoccus cyprini]TVT29154.1 Stk1 family PASTA domain-containing Ser/Thr kinase [Salinicoccus cyprini]